MNYREIELKEMNRSLFKEFNRYQKVVKCKAKVNGKWEIIDRPFIDDWTEEEYQFLVKCLTHTIEEGGVVFGCFVGNQLKGFASVEGSLIGSHGQYMDLTSLHVSMECRGRGIGKYLFLLAANWAKNRGAKKLYLSSHSAIESQEFYETVGCKEAEEYNQAHVEQEPCDIQLEYVL
ncbi:hypothetical protein lbkm_1208 [Lachnospiraceae bacterium KM106-2]|nr:hypothetical protein lbkm_1208 [Lachnospiraceae bacterium KM106-2]